jgi:hypothetical protein
MSLVTIRHVSTISGSLVLLPGPNYHPVTFCPFTPLGYAMPRPTEGQLLATTDNRAWTIPFRTRSVRVK